MVNTLLIVHKDISNVHFDDRNENIIKSPKVCVTIDQAPLEMVS